MQGEAARPSAASLANTHSTNNTTTNNNNDDNNDDHHPDIDISDDNSSTSSINNSRYAMGRRAHRRQPHQLLEGLSHFYRLVYMYCHVHVCS